MSHEGDWTVTLEFAAGRDDDGADLEAIVEAAHELAPENVFGLAARADTRTGRVWLIFTAEGVSEAGAKRLASDLQDSISSRVFGGGVSVAEAAPACA